MLVDVDVTVWAASPTADAAENRRGSVAVAT